MYVGATLCFKGKTKVYVFLNNVQCETGGDFSREGIVYSTGGVIAAYQCWRKRRVYRSRSPSHTHWGVPPKVWKSFLSFSQGETAYHSVDPRLSSPSFSASRFLAVLKTNVGLWDDVFERNGIFITHLLVSNCITQTEKSVAIRFCACRFVHLHSY